MHYYAAKIFYQTSVSRKNTKNLTFLKKFVKLIKIKYFMKKLISRNLVDLEKWQFTNIVRATENSLWLVFCFHGFHKVNLHF